jgi:hypothetical protein
MPTCLDDRRQETAEELEIMRRWRGAAVESENRVRAVGVCGPQLAGVFGGGRVVAGWAEGAQWCWRAVRRHRPPMDRSRP